MSVAERVRAIREAHGDSLREAARRTGISRSTLQRIEQGCDLRTLDTWLRQFARGYGVAEADLLDSRTPRGMFEWRIRQAHPTDRTAMAMLPIHGRVRLLLSFLQATAPAQLSPERLAAAAGLPAGEVEQALRTWRLRPPDLRTAQAIGLGLHTLFGISRTWILTGWLDEEEGIEGRLVDLLPKAAVLAQSARRPPRPSLLVEVARQLRRRPGGTA